MSQRCLGCMKLKEQIPVCEHCGYNENVPNYSHQLPIGTVLNGQYLVGKVLGQGGFGITYIGWDQSLQAAVAIKEYYPNSFVTRDCGQSLDVVCAGDSAKELFRLNRERFLREARILAKLHNVPGIVRVQNLFAENNTAYIVMEYVEGIDLKRYIRMQNRTLTVGETFAVLQPVMEALSNVHEAELVHRDISPDNIMILPDGSAKLLDFGAAREVENAEVGKDLPQSTEAILKHGFAPIEQYRRRGSLGPWTDVYGLCATMYYCLTGKVPNSAPERIMGDDNVNWRQIPGLTENQIAALEMGMAIMPESRILSMEALHQGLFSGKPLPARAVVSRKPADYPNHTLPLGDETPGVMEIKKSKKKPVAIIAAMLALVAALGIFLLKPRDTDEQSRITLPETVPETTVQTEPLPEETREALPVEATEAQPVNVLMSDRGPSAINGNEWEFFRTYTVLGSDIKRNKIMSVTFVRSLKDAPETAWDVSENLDGSVLAWVQTSADNYNYYDLYIGANGTITAPENCSYLFAGYDNARSIAFNDVLDTSSTTNMSNMFYGCTRLTELDVGSFDTGNVTDMSYMFCVCEQLWSISLRNFDTSNVTDMSGMFSACQNLNGIDVSSFDTSNVTNMSYMFTRLSVLQTLDLQNFDTSKVTDMSWMFSECGKLWKLMVGNWETDSVTNYEYFFFPDRKIEGQRWQDWFEKRKASNLMMSDWDPSISDPADVHQEYPEFSALGQSIKRRNVKSVTFLNTTADAPADCWDVSQEQDGSVVAWVEKYPNNYLYYDLYIAADGGVTAPENCGYLFCGYTQLERISFNGAFDTANTTSMSWMFNGCQSLTSVDMDTLNTSRVTDMCRMFCGCEGLTTLNLSSLNTSAVLDMNSMFFGCRNLKELNVDNFRTENVTDMCYMFAQCSSLTALDISSFDTSRVQYMDSMFNECPKLADLTVGEFETDSVKSYKSFIYDGKQINGEPWENLFEKNP